MRIGVIGTGTIGGMLAKGFAANAAAKVCLFNRTPEKAIALARSAPNLHTVDSLRDIVWFSEVIFLCTKAQDGEQVLRDIGGLMRSQQILATTISTIPLDALRRMTHAKVVKVIPSIAQSVRCGNILLCGASDLDPASRAKLEQLLAPLGVLYEVAEDDLRVASDLASCGPAFLAGLLNTWAEAAARQSGIPQRDCLRLLEGSVAGLAALIRAGWSPADVMARVAVPGGVTESGLKVIHEDAPALFSRIHQATASHAPAAPLMTDPG
ncbi:MAG: NAD(P)-binding domain-containing protein [Thermoflavifilum sp.]|nr:NAD(P)-binding domain-containing protein [Thermoflavifilum sp.]MCL6514725.1 NAD(P)-binding domain-containing protein [Alicyclobacillus sp.]